MMEDLRIEEADKIIKSICIYKTNKIRAVITEDNTLICIYDNTLMYIIKLKCQVILPAVFFVYDNDGNILGGIVAEFVEEKEESELESITEVLSKEAPYLSPILEFSDYRDLN